MAHRPLRHALAFVLVLFAALSAGRRGPPSFTPFAEPAATPLAPVLLDPNTASVEQLESLPGIGPTLARRIVEGRSPRGYERVDDLRRVRGIGERTLARLRPRLRIGARSEVAQEADADGQRDEVRHEVPTHEGERVGRLE